MILQRHISQGSRVLCTGLVIVVSPLFLVSVWSVVMRIIVDGFTVEMKDMDKAIAFILLCVGDGKTVTVSKL